MSFCSTWFVIKNIIFYIHCSIGLLILFIALEMIESAPYWRSRYYILSQGEKMCSLGLEPMTPRLQDECSPNRANQVVVHITQLWLSLVPWHTHPQNWKFVLEFQSIYKHNCKHCRLTKQSCHSRKIGQKCAASPGLERDTLRYRAKALVTELIGLLFTLSTQLWLSSVVYIVVYYWCQNSGWNTVSCISK